MRDVLAAEHPDCAVSLSSDVLNEYREYERAVTTLVDAFVKPRVAAYARSIHDRLGRLPFYIMKSNGGVIAGREVHRQPITTILSGPAAGTLGAALVARQAGFEHVITLDGGGTSTDVAVIAGGEPTPHHRGRGRPLRGQGADGRRRHGRHRRRLDRVGVARGDAEGRAALGRGEPGAGVLRPGRHRADRDRRLPAARAHPRAPARRRDPARPRGRARGVRAAGRPRRPRRRGVRRRRARDLGLEPGERDPPGHGQARARRARLRPLRVRRLGPAGRVPADRHPLAARGVRPARPRQPQRLRAAGHRPADRPRADAGAPPRPARPRRARGARSPGSRPRRARRSTARSHEPTRWSARADLRYFGQAFEIRVAPPPAPSRRSRPRSTTPTSARTATATATTRARSSSG